MEKTQSAARVLVASGRLFIGVYPAGLVYADRERDQHGDYLGVAFLPYRTLQLEATAECPAELWAQVEAHASAMQAKCGQAFQVSASGQAVILGQQ